MNVARELAERITSTRYEDLPPEASYWSKVAVLDTVGVTLAGAVEEAPRILEDVLEIEHGSGPSLVFGSARRVRCLDAALMNGVSSHTLDFDNTSNTMAGHMSATMIPALLAAAEAYGGTGKEVLLAHTIGFETGARFGHGLNFHHHEIGWHPTSTLGVFAVTAACARLLGLSAAQTSNALGLSTSLAAGIKANFGTMTKPLHAGQCARSGLLSALLSRKGFTALRHPWIDGGPRRIRTLRGRRLPRRARASAAAARPCSPSQIGTVRSRQQQRRRSAGDAHRRPRRVGQGRPGAGTHRSEPDSARVARIEVRELCFAGAGHGCSRTRTGSD